MNEEQLAAWKALNDSIQSCSKAGINGTRVEELKELATAFDALVNPSEDEQA